MGQFHWRELALFLVFAAIVLIGYGVLLSPPRTLCEPLDGYCVREWIGALSGWAAAVFAAAAIAPLIGQLREQQRQTSFTLGDAMPTVDIERRADLSILVRIVNWNRRVLDCTIRVYDANGELSFRSALRQTETMGNFDYTVQHFKALGWEDRASRPPFNEFAIELEYPADRSAIRGSLTVVLDGELIGEDGGRYYSKTVVRPWGSPPPA